MVTNGTAPCHESLVMENFKYSTFPLLSCPCRIFPLESICHFDETSGLWHPFHPRLPPRFHSGRQAHARHSLGVHWCRCRLLVRLSPRSGHNFLHRVLPFVQIHPQESSITSDKAVVAIVAIFIRPRCLRQRLFHPFQGARHPATLREGLSLWLCFRIRPVHCIVGHNMAHHILHPRTQAEKATAKLNWITRHTWRCIRIRINLLWPAWGCISIHFASNINLLLRLLCSWRKWRFQRNRPSHRGLPHSQWGLRPAERPGARLVTPFRRSRHQHWSLGHGSQGHRNHRKGSHIHDPLFWFYGGVDCISHRSNCLQARLSHFHDSLQGGLRRGHWLGSQVPCLSRGEKPTAQLWWGEERCQLETVSRNCCCLDPHPASVGCIFRFYFLAAPVNFLLFLLNDHIIHQLKLWPPVSGRALLWRRKDEQLLRTTVYSRSNLEENLEENLGTILIKRNVSKTSRRKLEAVGR